MSGPDQVGEFNKTGVSIANGAANDMNNSLIVAVAESLSTAGYTTLRFNFPYQEKVKKSPGTESTLIRTWQSAVTHILNNERFRKNFQKGSACNLIISKCFRAYIGEGFYRPVSRSRLIDIDRKQYKISL